MKRIFGALLLALILLTSASAEDENLILNPQFQLDEGDLYPSYWTVSSWNSANTLYDVVQEDGENALYLYSYENNDARWVQDVAVEPGKTYRISCMLKASECSYDGRGANISVLNTNVYSESVYDTEGEWVEVEVFGKAAKKQSEISVALRVGGYSGDCTGKAWFRDVRVTLADDASDLAMSLATFEPFTASSSSETPDSLPERQTPKWLLFGFITALAFVAMSAKARQPQALAPKPIPALERLALIATCLLALGARVYYALTVHGYAVDINCFSAWGESFFDHGFAFYANVNFCDYPPLYMVLMGFVSLLRRLFGFAYGSQAHIFLVKLFPMLADMASAFMLYFMARRRGLKALSLMLFAFIAVNPAYIANSAAWGQVDSLLALMLLCVVCLAQKRKWILALFVFALAVLTKPQALIFGPVGLILLICDVRKDRRLIDQALIALAVSVGTIYLVSLPFALSVYEGGVLGAVVYPFRWIWKQLFASATGYSNLTVNACNLYTLLKRNWAELDGGALSVLSWALMGLSYVFCAFLMFKGRDRQRLPLIGCALMGLIFAFAPMMHERYLFPALLLALCAFVGYRDLRILYYFILITVTQFLNTALVLEWGQYPGFEGYGHLQSNESVWNGLISLLNCAGALFMAWTAWDITINAHLVTAKEGKADAKRHLPEAQEDWRLHLKRFDALCMAVVTVLYGAFAFWNLGTTVSPQRGWQSKEYREQIVFDLGEVRSFRLTYFGGICNTNFTVSLSNDAQNWTEENFAVYAAGDMYRWIWYAPQKYNSNGELTNAPLELSRVVDTGKDGALVSYPTSLDPYPLQTARYVRFTVNGAGLLLNEVAFIDTANECLYPIQSVTSTSGDNGVSRLIDEQDAVHLVPSYYNGMYFDEIYHARTAYEMLNRYPADSILEWSHPHLGKLIIMLGIKLFGMTPFGWRCMGTLFGALMLPLMYLLVKQLSGNKWLSLSGMLLLALDSMHFTQTRIATVDTYAVFFIMLMYLFMIRYAKMSLLRQPLWRTLLPLGASGLGMALACASKWTGIYASVGLAVIFFVSLFSRIGQYLRLKASGDDQIPTSRVFWGKIALTLAFCVVAFIAVPLAVYYFSYYWHYASSGGLSLEKVWTLQKSMYNYHSTLVDNHYFKTPWYEWPLIVKPMWYYSSDIAYTGRGVVSSISCMGNPAVWWMGLAALIVMLVRLCWGGLKDKNALYVAIGFASQFLPWVLVPRSTFIYHYFASIPFIILAIALCWKYLAKIDRFAAEYSMGALLIAALVLFAMFYPLESGKATSYDYAMLLRWFDWYNFQLQ